MRLTGRLVCLMIALICLACGAAHADEVRKLPIDLSGGAPYEETYRDDVWEYEDPSIHVVRDRVDSREWGVVYYPVMITISDASQLRTASADPNGFPASRGVPCAAMAKRVNAVLALNGDYCSSFNGNETNKYILRQGQVYQDTVDESLDMLLIDEDGDFHVLKAGPELATAEKTEVGGKKVINALQFGPALVIDGEKVEDEYILDRQHSSAFAEPDKDAQRMCICQLGPLQYMVLCTRYGVTLAELRDMAMSIADCKTVYVLDGGNSAQLVFLKKKINNVTSQSQNVRNIPDIVYFASAYFTD